MPIGIESQMAFGDGDALLVFALAHRLTHDAYAKVIDQKTSPTPNFDVGDGQAHQDWIKCMKDGAQATPSLLTWLQWHQNLHQAEYAAIGMSNQPDILQVDFSQEDQFATWMQTHAQIHLDESAALGVA